MTDPHNDALEAAAQLAAGEPSSHGDLYRTWPWWGTGNEGVDSGLVKFCDALAAQIRGLKGEPVPPSADVAGVLERLAGNATVPGDIAFIRTLAAERDAIKDDYLRRHKDACDRYLEIVALKSDIHHLIADPAAELGCQADNETVLQAIVDLKQERDAALTALRTMNAVADHQTNRVFPPMEFGGVTMPCRVHPLTCGNDSRHTVLFPCWTGERVVLRCPDCDYEQNNTGPIARPFAPAAPPAQEPTSWPPKPARDLSDQELQTDFTEHCQRWDKVAAKDGHSGSPGEWIVERLDELKIEAKRRGLALVEPPRPAREP